MFVAVKCGQKGVMCGCWQCWYHTDCMGMSTHTYGNLDKSKVIWISGACGDPNYSACHLFTASITDTSNTFDSLGSLDGDGSLSLGSPMATSSPVDKPIKTPYSFKGVLHPWALFLKILSIFSKNKATSDKISYGFGQKCPKELKNHSSTTAETIVLKL